MRFIIREQDSERLLAAGLFRYLHRGQPTGAAEEWRLTEVKSDYSVMDRNPEMAHFRVLRTDYDERELKNKRSTLFHLVINHENQPERLKIRQFSPTSEGWADLIMNEDSITLTQDFGHGRRESEAEYNELPGILYSSITWLGNWVAQQALNQASDPLWLNQNDIFELSRTSAAVQRGRAEEIVIGGQGIAADHYSLILPDRNLDFWVDRFGLTIKAVLSEELSVVESRYIRYM